MTCLTERQLVKYFNLHSNFNHLNRVKKVKGIYYPHYWVYDVNSLHNNFLKRAVGSRYYALNDHFIIKFPIKVIRFIRMDFTEATTRYVVGGFNPINNKIVEIQPTFDNFSHMQIIHSAKYESHLLYPSFDECCEVCNNYNNDQFHSKSRMNTMESLVLYLTSFNILKGMYERKVF